MSMGLISGLQKSSSALAEELEWCGGDACRGSVGRGGLDVLGKDVEARTVSNAYMKVEKPAGFLPFLAFEVGLVVNVASSNDRHLKSFL
jgi:hypothetical protein